MRIIQITLTLLVSLNAMEITISTSEELKQALTAVESGTTLSLRNGNYHIESTISDLNDITIRSVTGERAVIDGTRKITSSWEKHNGAIYKTKLNEPIWQLFIDGVQQTGARWPNAKYSDNTVFDQENNWAQAESSTNGSLSDSRLIQNDLTGAMAVLNCGSFRSYTEQVTNTSGITLQHDTVPVHKGGSFPYFLDAHLSLLDSEEEWFYDPVDSLLYVWGNPTGKEIRGKVQSYAFSIENSSNIVIKDLDFFATAFQITASDDVTVEGNRFAFPATNKRMLKISESPEVISVYKSGSDNFQFKNNLLEYTDGEALYTEGTNCVVQNNYMHTLDYTGTSRRGLAVTFWLKGPNLYFSQNTIHTTGSSEMLVGGTQSKLSYNHIRNTGYIQNDGAIFQMTRQNVEGSEIHHNWLHDTPKYAVRFDAPAGEPALAGQYGTVHHNVLWNCTKAMMIKGDNHHIYNNTVFNSEDNDMIILSESNGNSNTHTFNNLVAKLSGHRAKSISLYPAPGTLTTNYNGYTEEIPVTDLFPSWNSFDFTSNSPLLSDAGSVINGFPESYNGAAPDIGAYETDGELWKAGTTIDTTTFHPWPWSLSGTVISPSGIKSSFNKIHISQLSQWEIYDFRGRLIKRNRNRDALLSSLPAGFYLIKPVGIKNNAQKILVK